MVLLVDNNDGIRLRERAGCFQSTESGAYDND